ncbi:unnamed protein product [Amoebophrya sp. A120]|nr:unnamed protein product [Amoebophrya sp. A120]|eukprot:GSA120T00002756001.1
MLGSRWNGKVTMYHATDRQSARSIINQQHMSPGSGGMLGPGIYFSMNCEAASRKRRRYDDDDQVTLSATVDLGETGFFADGHRVDSYEMDAYDIQSAKVNAPRRDSFMVLDSWRVTNMEVFSGDLYSDDDEDDDDDDYDDYSYTYSSKRQRY